MVAKYQREITITDRFAGLAVKDYLKQIFLPKHLRGNLRQSRGLQVNGQQVSTAHVLRTSDHLTLTFREEVFLDHQGPYPANMAVSLTIVYENEDLMVVNKPAGMKMHPHSPTETDTLLNYVNGYFQKNPQKSAGQPSQAFMVHRLDRATSGLVIVAKNPIAVPILNRLIKEKNIKRTYLARVTGLFDQKTGTFDQKIGDHPSDDRLRWLNPAGQNATTHYQVLEEESERDESLVRLELETGRMHQLRVHLAGNGHPINGDDLYHGKAGKRLALHSTALSLILPFTGNRVLLEERDRLI
ncbi:RluA family pseudouridine synthase [Fructobacillus tropaeoli]|uniref:RluA family pseudouridine synthase n=1 Tax=Fructobacillus tropaeoli TaxID=709323 RepID=UPI002D9613F8|nr:23S rRNA- or tRNA-specific (RluA) [Fructobacillus tropaeoli]